MDVQQIKTQAIRFNRARNNLLAVVILTLANLVLIVLDTNLNFPFSAIVPQVVLILFMDIAMPIAMAAAVICVSFYLLFFFLSKRWRVFILVAFIFFAMDTLFLIDIMLANDFFDFILDIAFHGWIHFYLITGTIAWAKLGNVTRDEFKELVAKVEQEANQEELDSALDTIAPDEEDDSNKSDNEKNKP